MHLLHLGVCSLFYCFYCGYCAVIRLLMSPDIRVLDNYATEKLDNLIANVVIDSGTRDSSWKEPSHAKSYN